MALQDAGNVAPDTMEIGSMTALKYYVQSGLGIALVPEIAVRPVPEGTAVRTMTGSLVDMTIGLLCKPSDIPSHQAVSKLYRFFVRELAEPSAGAS
jgi:DNA-binding transcriptional LysR family regulator